MMEERSSEGWGIYTFGGKVKVSQDHFSPENQPIMRRAITRSLLPFRQVSLKIRLYVTVSRFPHKSTCHAEPIFPQDHHHLGSTHDAVDLDHPRPIKDDQISPNVGNSIL